MARLTDGDQPTTLMAADICASIYTVGHERVVGRPCSSDPYLFLFRRRPEVEWVISYLRLIQHHCQGVTPSNSKVGLPAPEAEMHAERET